MFRRNSWHGVWCILLIPALVFLSRGSGGNTDDEDVVASVVAFASTLSCLIMGWKVILPVVVMQNNHKGNNRLLIQNGKAFPIFFIQDGKDFVI